MTEILDEDMNNLQIVCNAYLNALYELAINPTAENIAAADEAGKEWDKIG
jgi:hypothetical protein